jgi:hypothetical protein
MSHSRHKSTLQEKQRWLESHPELRGQTRHQIVAAMKKAGLIAPSTYPLDVFPKDGPCGGIPND